jgi:hypothetical protein
MLGEGLRREERLLSRTSKDVRGLSHRGLRRPKRGGFSAALPPHTTPPARPESYRSLGQAFPTGSAQDDELGRSAPLSGGSGPRNAEIAIYSILFFFS